ncbi:MAG: hypothetical protein ACK5LK_05610, partial [Chthoniobacterales bacterium]
LPLILEGNDQQKTFLKWFRSNKPDAIIAQQTEIVDWLKAGKVNVPEKVGIAFTGLPEDNSAAAKYSGILPQSKALGVAAMDLLHGAIIHRDEGIPLVQQSLLIQGIWQDGSTTRRVNRRE